MVTARRDEWQRRRNGLSGLNGLNLSAAGADTLLFWAAHSPKLLSAALRRHRANRQVVYAKCATKEMARHPPGSPIFGYILNIRGVE